MGQIRAKIPLQMQALPWVTCRGDQHGSWVPSRTEHDERSNAHMVVAQFLQLHYTSWTLPHQENYEMPGKRVQSPPVCSYQMPERSRVRAVPAIAKSIKIAKCCLQRPLASVCQLAVRDHVLGITAFSLITVYRTASQTERKLGEFSQIPIILLTVLILFMDSSF